MIISPCISICKTDPVTGYCYGCGRNDDEKKIWKDPQIITPAFLHLGIQSKNGINNKYVNAWDLSKRVKDKYIITPEQILKKLILV